MGRIIVGFDGSDASIAALEWALDEAGHRGSTVEAIHAWSVPPSDPYLPLAVDRDVFRSGAVAVLAHAVDLVAARADPPPFVPTLVEGSPAGELVHASEGAELLVVGSDDGGGLAELLLGSVTRKVLHRARCPVVVVRPANVLAGHG